MVPKVYGQCRQYIFKYLKFCEGLLNLCYLKVHSNTKLLPLSKSRVFSGLPLSHTEIDDVIRKSTNVLLTRTLSGALTVLLKTQGLSLQQLIQIAVNMNYLEKSCDFLEEFISSTTGYAYYLVVNTTKIVRLYNLFKSLLFLPII